MGVFFQNLSPSVTLKMGSRSPKSNQFLSLSQQYSCTNLVKIHPFILKIGSQKTFSNNLSPPVTLKTRYWSPKSNRFFYMSQEYSCANLVKIHSFLLFFFFFFFFFLIWVLRPFQEYFTYIEPIVHRRWAKTGVPGEKPPDHP